MNAAATKPSGARMALAVAAFLGTLSAGWVVASILIMGSAGGAPGDRPVAIVLGVGLLLVLVLLLFVLPFVVARRIWRGQPFFGRKVNPAEGRVGPYAALSRYQLSLEVERARAANDTERLNVLQLEIARREPRT